MLYITLKEKKKTKNDARSGDLSAIAGDSILASFSKLNGDLSIIPPSANTGKNMQQSVSSLPGGNGDDKANIDMKHNIGNNEPDGVFSAEETAHPSSTTIVMCNSAQHGGSLVASLGIIGE